MKGYDLGGGEYVIVTPEELESVEPGRSRTIEITDFVDLDAIDPIYYKSTYYLGPQGDQAVRPYALLREAMAQSNKVAVASLVLRTKEHLVTIRPTQSVLALETMYFADEIRDPMTEIPGRAGRRRLLGPRAEHRQDADRLDGEPPGTRASTRTSTAKRVEGLIDEKRQGKVIVTERPETQPTKVVDLMEALQASVEAARSHRPGAHIATPATERQGAAPSDRPHATGPRPSSGAQRRV